MEYGRYQVPHRWEGVEGCRVSNEYYAGLGMNTVVLAMIRDVVVLAPDITNVYQ